MLERILIERIKVVAVHALKEKLERVYYGNGQRDWDGRFHNFTVVTSAKRRKKRIKWRSFKVNNNNRRKLLEGKMSEVRKYKRMTEFQKKIV